MKSTDVQIGKTYTAKVSGILAPVKIVGTSVHGGWVARNQQTGREVQIRSSRRLRGPWTGGRTKANGKPPEIRQGQEPAFLTQYRALKRDNPELVLFFRVGSHAPRFAVCEDDARMINNHFGRESFTAYVDGGKETVGLIEAWKIEEGDGSAGPLLRRIVEDGHQAAICERVSPEEFRDKPIERIVLRREQ